MSFLERVLKKRCKCPLRHMKFSGYWNIFQGNGCTKVISLRDETLIKCSYKQAWILLRSRLLRVLKFWKQFHTNWYITQSRGKMLGRRNTQPCLNFSFIGNWQTISTKESLIETFVLGFSAQYLISGNSGWKRYSHVIFANKSRSMFRFMVIIEENACSHRYAFWKVQ